MTGTVFAAALNRRETLEALGEALSRDPYRSPPKAPVLHLKPANTWIGPGEPIPCPPDVPALRMGGTIGLVIGRTASSVTETEALSYLGGLVVVNDVSIPYQSHYRPAIKQRCRDGFCPIGPVVVPAGPIDPDRLEVVIEVDGQVQSRTSGNGLVRGAARVLADISEFITLQPGDILLLGEPHQPPLATPGQQVRIIVEGVGSLDNPVRWE